ncbi:endothelin-converting enzyme homolog isoform X3 [Cloeon dipterum]|uniref:endothelin-converting enzyme homolog isoform X3 n=1 Tax=Cloeon dipterum TaxID=197152 RepID=UPI00321F66BF
MAHGGSSPVQDFFGSVIFRRSEVSYRPAESDDGDGSLSSRAKNRNPLQAASTFFHQRTTLEKILLVLVVFLFITVVIICIFIRGNPQKLLLVGSHLLREKGAEGYCMTTACVTAAASILQTMDQSVNPCEDFYQYACGGWSKTTVIPEGKSLWGTFSVIEQQNQRVIKKILEQPKGNRSSSAEDKAKMYYISCMDPNNTIETLGAAPLQEILTEVGGWNVSGKFEVKDWQLQKSLHVLQIKYGMNGLFSWAVNEDDKNSSRYAIQVDQGGLTLPTTAHYLNKTTNAKIMQAYLEYMVNIGTLLGGEKNATTRQMQEVIDFETEIANITTPTEERRDDEKLYHSMKVTELQSLAPFINWLDYFNEAFKMVNKKIAPNDSIIVYAPDYLQNLTKIIDKYSKTDDGKNIINFYLQYLVDHAADEIRKQVYLFSTYFYPRLTSDIKKSVESKSGCVRPWKSEDVIFNFKYAVIPINENDHWFLSIAILPSFKTKATKTSRRCRVYVLNSMLEDEDDEKEFDHVGRAVNIYLAHEYMRVYSATFPNRLDDYKVIVPCAPQQGNGSDCGLFLLEYFEQFLKVLEKKSSLDKVDFKKWFPSKLASKKRARLRGLIDTLKTEELPKKRNVTTGKNSPEKKTPESS